MGYSAKVERYLELLDNQKKLVSASQTIIRRSKSPKARRIANGDVKAIIIASKDRISGTLTKEEKISLCKLLCEFKAKLKNKTPDQSMREIFAWVINSMIGLIDTTSGLMISLLWVIRQQLYFQICGCSLDKSCSSNPCLSLN